jgi:lysophospholipase L1-like esterase
MRQGSARGRLYDGTVFVGYPAGVRPFHHLYCIAANNGHSWGTPFAQYMDVSVVNLARGGRSARSYTREGLFAALVEQITPGDYVVIEFGHNDG